MFVKLFDLFRYRWLNHIIIIIIIPDMCKSRSIINLVTYDALPPSPLSSLQHAPPPDIHDTTLSAISHHGTNYQFIFVESISLRGEAITCKQNDGDTTRGRRTRHG